MKKSFITSGPDLDLQFVQAFKQSQDSCNKIVRRQQSAPYGSLPLTVTKYIEI